MEQVLLIDDASETQQVARSLVPGGFRVEAESSGEACLRRALAGEAVALLLSVDLPGLNSFDLLRRLRAESRLPVLLLLEPEHELDGIIGLEMGADDYLLKPINPRALLARLRAILRRVRHASSSPLPPPLLTSGALTLDELLHTAWCGGKKLALTAVEFDLLRALLRAQGQALTREELARNILGRPFHPTDRSLDVHISKLRKKLGDGNCIKAVRGVGYIFTSGGELG